MVNGQKQSVKFLSKSNHGNQYGEQLIYPSSNLKLIGILKIIGQFVNWLQNYLVQIIG